MFDIKIIGGTVVDGTGEPGRRAAVGITGDRIEAIGDLSQAEAGRTIDAEGMTVSPGFIDTHVHSDAVLLTNPQHPEGILQGITTEILGQDGLSYCPLSADNYRVYGRYLRGILGDPPEGIDTSSVATFREAYRRTTAVNTAYLIAHGALRLETCGFEDVPMTGDRLKHAQRLVREGMEQGAVGLATGLSYHPAGMERHDGACRDMQARRRGGRSVRHPPARREHGPGLRRGAACPRRWRSGEGRA